jgi:hypothetical protein
MTSTVIESGSFESFGLSVGKPVAEVVNDSAVINATEEAVIAYRNLGMLKDAGRARERFGEKFDALHGALQSDGLTVPTDMIIVPKFSAELSPVDLTARLADLFKSKNDRLWNRSGAHSYSQGRGEEYTFRRLNQGQTVLMEAQAVLLQRPSDSKEAGRCSNELFYAGKSIAEQRKSMKEWQKEAKESGAATLPASMSLAGYIVRQAMLLERGETLMDCGSENEGDDTATVLPELVTKSSGVIVSSLYRTYDRYYQATSHHALIRLGSVNIKLQNHSDVGTRMVMKRQV